MAEGKALYAVFFLQMVALTLNIGYIADKLMLMLTIAMVASFISTVVKVKSVTSARRSHTDVMAFLCSIIADLHFIPAFFIQAFHLMGEESVVEAVALSMGALIANAIAVLVVIIAVAVSLIKEK